MKIREMSVRAEICACQSNCCLESSHNQAQISFSRTPLDMDPYFLKKSITWLKSRSGVLVEFFFQEAISSFLVLTDECLICIKFC